MQIDPKDRFVIQNTNTGNFVESHKTAEQVISACNTLNRHNVVFNNALPRCIIIDTLTGEKFLTSLEYML